MFSTIMPAFAKFAPLAVANIALAITFVSCPEDNPGPGPGPDLSPDVTSVSPSTVTQGQQATFTAFITGSVTGYSWDFGGGVSPDTSTSSAPKVTPGTPGSYTGQITASNSTGSDVFPFTYEVKTNDPPPIADFHFGEDGENHNSGPAGTIVLLNADDSYDPGHEANTNRGIAHYFWDVGADGTWESVQTVPQGIRQPMSQTTTVRLKVDDVSGQESTVVSHTFTVTP